MTLREAIQRACSGAGPASADAASSFAKRMSAVPRLRAITRTPGVVGGRACVEGTRMPVWSILAAWRLGYSDEQILMDYPTLRRTDLTVVRYYLKDLRHALEIERDIRQQDEA